MRIFKSLLLPVPSISTKKISIQVCPTTSSTPQYKEDTPTSVSRGWLRCILKDTNSFAQNQPVVTNENAAPINPARNNRS